MGDLLMSLPAIHAARVSFPDAEITLLLQKGLEPLLNTHPEIDRILCWEPGEGIGWPAVFRWVRQLRHLHLDAAVVLNPTRFFHTALFLAGIPIRVGYRRKWGFLLTRAIPDTKTSRSIHESEYNLELVRLLGIEPGPAVLSLPQNPADEAAAQRRLEQLGLAKNSRPIALHPWTSNPIKSWPLESFRELTNRLISKGYPVLIIGGPEVRPEMDAWKKTLGPAADGVGQIPLELLPAALKRCALLISNDSGPVHVAAGVNTPTFVAAPKEHGVLLNRWRPLGRGHRIFLSPGVEEIARAVREQVPCES